MGQAQNFKATPTQAINIAAMSVTATSWVEHLPTILTILSIIWITIQIMASVDKWLSTKRYAKGSQGEKGEKGDKGDDCVYP